MEPFSLDWNSEFSDTHSLPPSPPDFSQFVEQQKHTEGTCLEQPKNLGIQKPKRTKSKKCWWTVNQKTTRILRKFGHEKLGSLERNESSDSSEKKEKDGGQLTQQELYRILNKLLYP